MTDIKSLSTSPAKQSAASWSKLLLVFLLALVLFVAVRWQPESWLHSQIISQTEKQGIALQYTTL